MNSIIMKKNVSFYRKTMRKGDFPTIKIARNSEKIGMYNRTYWKSLEVQV